MITSAELERAMSKAGCTEREIDTELMLVGPQLIEWANKVPGAADPVADGDWDENFANEVWDNLHRMPIT